MRVWMAILLVGAGSYVFRAAPLFVGRVAQLSPHARATAERAGTASLVALAAITIRHQTVDVEASAAVAAAAAIAVGSVLAARRHALHTVAIAGVLVHLAVSAALAGAS